MDEIKKLKINIESLSSHINSDKKFFSSIITFVQKMENMLIAEKIDIEELVFLIEKVEEFYENYRPSYNPGVFYIPPEQTSNSDSTVRELMKSVESLKTQHRDNLIVNTLVPHKEIVENNYTLSLQDNRLLDACKSSFDVREYWNFVFNATRHLEVRIREKAGLAATLIGTDLVTKAFHQDTGKLKIPCCATKSEDEGFFHIIRGIVMFHRNAKSHREGTIEKKRAVQIVNYIDYLIDIIESAVMSNR